MAERKRLSAFDLVQQRNQSSGSDSDFLARNPLPQITRKQPTGGGYLGDLGTSLKAGVLELPSVATGLADISAGLAGFNRPYSRAADAIGDFTGLDFDTWAQEARQQYSPQTQTALEAVRQASDPDAGFLEGLGQTTKAALANPRSIGVYAAEALPGTIAGGGVAGLLARGAAKGAAKRELKRMDVGPVQPAKTPLLARPAVAGGIGEGAVAGGYAMSGTDESVDPQRAALGALATGAGVGLIGGLGASAARRLGVSDPDLLFVDGRPQPIPGKPRRNILTRMSLGAVAEGVFEELPQTAYETMVSNYVEGRNIFEGVGSDAAMGMLAGGVLGAGTNIFGGRRDFEEPKPDQPPADKPDTPDAAAPADSKTAFIGNLKDDQLYGMWARSIDAAKNYREDPETLEKIRGYQQAMRDEFNKRGLPPERVAEGVDYENYKVLRGRIDTLQNEVDKATAIGGRPLANADAKLSAALAELTLANNQNPDFAGQFDAEVEQSAKEAYFDQVEQLRKLEKKVAKQPPRSLKKSDRKNVADRDALLEEVNRLSEKNPEWAAEAAEVLSEQEAAKSAKSKGDTEASEPDGKRAVVDQITETQEVSDKEWLDSIDDERSAVEIDAATGEVADIENVDFTEDASPAVQQESTLPVVEEDEPADGSEELAVQDDTPQTVSEKIKAQVAKEKAQLSIAGKKYLTERITDFLNDNANSGDYLAARNSYWVAKGLRELEDKLETLDENGVIGAIAALEKQVEKAEAKGDKANQKKLLSDKRKLRFAKSYQEEKGYATQTRGQMLQAAEEDAAQEVEPPVNDTGLAFVRDVLTPDSDTQLSEQASEAAQTITMEDINRAFDYMLEVPGLGVTEGGDRAGYQRLSESNLRVLREYVNVLQENAADVAFRSSVATPWLMLAERMADLEAQGEYKGTTDTSNLKKSVNKMLNNFRAALKLSRSDLKPDVVNAMVRKLYRDDDSPNRSYREKLIARAETKGKDSPEYVQLDQQKKNLQYVNWWYYGDSDSDAPSGLGGTDPFSKIANETSKMSGEDRIAAVLRNTYLPIRNFVPTESILWLNAWNKKQKALYAKLRLKQDDILAARASLDNVDNPATPKESEEILNDGTPYEDLYREGVSLLERDDLATWEEVIANPSALRFFAQFMTPETISNSPAAMQQQADTLFDLFLQSDNGLSELYMVLGEEVENDLGLNISAEEQVAQFAEFGEGQLSEDFVRQKLDSYVLLRTALNYKPRLRKALEGATAILNNTEEKSYQQIEQQIADDQKEVADIEAIIAEGSERKARILEQANQAALKARKEAARQLRAAEQARLSQRKLQQPMDNALPFADLAAHPMYEGVRKANDLAAQPTLGKGNLKGKVGPTLAAIARKEVNPFTWAKASAQRGGYESTLSPNGVMFTIRKSPDNPKVQQLWVVKDSINGEINEERDALWAETGEQDLKTRADLRELAQIVDASASYYSVDIDTAVAAQSKERSRKRVEAQNRINDALSGTGFAGLAVLKDSNFGTATAIIKEPSRRGEYGPARPTVTSIVFALGSKAFRNGMSEAGRLQVIGDPRVEGSDPIVDRLVTESEAVNVGDYRAKLFWVTVPAEQVEDYLASEAGRVILDDGANKIAVELQNMQSSEELNDKRYLTGPIFNYAENKVKNLSHLKSMLETGATEIKFISIVPDGRITEFRKRLKDYKVDAYTRSEKRMDALIADLAAKRAEGKKKQESDVGRFFPSYNYIPVEVPSTVAEVKAVVQRVLSEKQNVTVVQSLSEIEALITSGKLQITPTTAGFVYQDRVYLIADNIEQGNTLGVLLHEAGVHTSMPQEMVNQFADEIRQAAASGDPIAQSAIDRAEAAGYYAASNGAQIDFAAANQETVAYFVEEAVNNYNVTPTQMGRAPAPVRALLTKIIGYIRRALVSLGIRYGRLEAQNLVDVAYGMANNPIRRPMSEQEFLASDSATASAINRAQRVWESAGEPGRARFKALYDSMRTYRDRFLFGHDFGKKVAAAFPQMAAYNRIVREGNTARGAVDADLQRLIAPFDGFSRKTQQKINKFLLETQSKGAWAFDPVEAGVPNPTRPEEINESLRAEFNALPVEQQEFIKSVFIYASKLQQELHDAINQEIRVRYESLLASAETTDEHAQLSDQLAKDLRAHEATKSRRIAGWLPLRRHGKYAAIFKSNTMQQLLDERDSTGKDADLDKQIKEMRADPAHYEVRFFESRVDAIEAVSEMSSSPDKQPGIAESFTREQVIDSGEAVPAYMLNSLEANLRDVEYGNPEQRNVTANALRRAVTKMYIAGLAETNARKSELGRDLVAGADGNMIRGFLDYGQSIGTTIASLKTGQKTSDIMREMRKEARKSSPDMDRQRKSDVFSEIMYRHTSTINPDPEPLVDSTLGVTSFWMLLTSPAYYMQNATQPWLMTLPMLAGKFGLGASSAALSRNYSVVSKAWGKAHEDLVGRLTRGDTKAWGGELADLEAIRNEIGEEAYQMLVDMKEQGVFDVGVSADFGNVYQSNSNTLLAKATNVFGRIHKKLVHGVRSVEVYNRGVTALAAYQLAKQNPNGLPMTVGENGTPRRMTPQEYAFDVVMGTQGDYSGANAPSIIKRTPGGKIVFQFRKFQLIQMTMFADMLKRAFADADPMERAIARRQIGYLFGANMMVGGLLALPAANIASALAAYAFGDEEEPDNFEMMMREYIGDPVLADVVLKGLPTLVDQDWSAKLGWGATYSVLPYSRLDISKEGVYQTVGTLVAGPTGAAVGNVANGVSMMLEGDAAGGAMETMPRGVRDVGRAYFAATRGVVDRSPYRKVLIEADEVTGAQVFSQALGAPSATTQRMFSVTRGVRDAKAFYAERSKEIQAKYVRARRDRDPTAQREAREEWRKLQASRVREGFPRQDISVLVNSVQEVREAERNVRSGVPFDQSTRRYVERRT